MSFYLIIALITLILIASVIFYIIYKIKKEESKAKEIEKAYSNALKNTEESIKKANDEKKKLNTGTPSTDVSNATDIMRNISSKRSKS